MSALARYPVPQAVASGAVDPSRLYFRLEPTVVPDPVLDFLAPLRAPREAIETGSIGKPRLYFRFDPPVVLEFLRPLRAPEAIAARAVGVPTLHFRLETAVVAVTAGTRRQRQLSSFVRTTVKKKKRKAKRKRC